MSTPESTRGTAPGEEPRAVLVTGAGSGIGRATALAFARSGDELVLAGRTESKLREVAEEIGRPRTLVAPLHHEASEEVTATIERVVGHFGRLDVLVNNAGVYVGTRVAETSDASWQASLDMNLTGPFLMTRAALPHLRRSPRGAIVNVASTLGERPIPGSAPYSVAKAALLMLTRSTALEEAGYGVRVNAVCPGVVDTPIHVQRLGENDAALDTFRASMAAAHPLGRIGTPEEIAALIVFLASEASGWTTGAIVPIDGGISLA